MKVSFRRCRRRWVLHVPKPGGAKQWPRAEAAAHIAVITSGGGPGEGGELVVPRRAASSAIERVDGTSIIRDMKK